MTVHGLLVYAWLDVRTRRTMLEREDKLGWGRTHSLEPGLLKAMVKPYVDEGRKTSALEQNPFLYLAKYMQLQETYGWEAFNCVQVLGEVPRRVEAEGGPGPN